MKKFFELSVTGRKSVKGDLLLSAIALSKDGRELGQLDINVLKEENNYGVFLKYTLLESSSLDRISTVRLTGRDEHEIREILRAIPTALQDSISKSSDPNPKAFTYILLASVCINYETNSVTIPEALGLNITNELISSIIGDEWLGIEVKISSDIQDKISILADVKRKKEEEDAEAILSAFKNAFSEM